MLRDDSVQAVRVGSVIGDGQNSGRQVAHHPHPLRREQPREYGYLTRIDLFSGTENLLHV